MITYDYIGPDRVLERTDINGVRLSHLDDDRKQDIGYDRIKREVLRRHLAHTTNVMASSFDPWMLALLGLVLPGIPRGSLFSAESKLERLPWF